MPRCLTKKDVWEAYREEFAGEPEEDVLSYVHFTRLWEEEFKFVRVPKVIELLKCNFPRDSITFCVQADRSFGRCSTCGALKHERQAALAKNDYEKAELMKKLIERHNFLQQSERQEDQARLLLARKYPSKYMHLVIDGADSGKGLV